MNLALKRMVIKKVGGEPFAVPNNDHASAWSSKDVRAKGHKFDPKFTIDESNFDPTKIREPEQKAGVAQANRQLDYGQKFAGHGKLQPTTKAQGKGGPGKGPNDAAQIFDELQAEMQRQRVMNVL